MINATLLYPEPYHPVKTYMKRDCRRGKGCPTLISAHPYASHLNAHSLKANSEYHPSPDFVIQCSAFNNSELTQAVCALPAVLSSLEWSAGDDIQEVFLVFKQSRFWGLLL